MNGWLFLPSLYKYSLSTLCMPDIVLGLGAAGNRETKIPALQEFKF